MSSSRSNRWDKKEKAKDIVDKDMGFDQVVEWMKKFLKRMEKKPFG